MTQSAEYFSSSEEQLWVNCRLAHQFRHELQFAPRLSNRKLSLGIIFHIGHEAIYKEHTLPEVLGFVDDAIELRKIEIEKAFAGEQVPADVVVNYAKDTALVRAMVKDYPAWLLESGVDVGYETVAVEQALTVEFPGTPYLFRGKLDLLQRNLTTERLRIVDAKTASSFSDDHTLYELSEQNGNYQLAVLATYDERPTELAYREARKMNPTTNPKSKPPYYREVPIRLTREEMVVRARTFAMNANAAHDPDRDIYPNPGACCGSWKNDWRQPCSRWHQGDDAKTALLESPAFEPRNPYERYEKEDGKDG